MLSWWPGGLGEGQSCPSKDSSHIVWVWCVAWALGLCWHTDRALWVLGYKLSYSFGEGHAYYRRLCYIIIPPDPIGILQCSFGASSVLLVPITTCEFIIPKEKKKISPNSLVFCQLLKHLDPWQPAAPFLLLFFLFFMKRNPDIYLEGSLQLFIKEKEHYLCNIIDAGPW